MSDTGGVSEGWYPDPSQPGMERWWSGAEWGNETRPLEVPAAPPPPVQAPPAAMPAPQSFQAAPPPASSPEKKKSGCFGIASGVMFGIIGAVVLLVGGCAALLASGSNNDDRVSIQTSTTTSADGQPDSQATEAETAEDEPMSEAEDVVACTRVDEQTIELEIVNNSSKTSSYFLTVGFFDESGARLADEAAFVNYLRPGERAIEEQFTFEEQGTVCEVIDVDRFAAESIAEEVAEVSACEILPEADIFGDFQATISATNSSPQTSDYSIDVAFVDPDGVRRGHGSTYIEAVRTGETAPGDFFSSATYADGYTCEVIGVTRNANN